MNIFKKNCKLKLCIQNFILLCFSICFSYILAEAIFYVWEQKIVTSMIPVNVSNIRDYDFTLPVPFPEARWLPDGGSILHIRSSSLKLMYELRPNAVVGEYIKINSKGFRDREFSAKKDINVFRICVVGDSIPFGWGIKLEDTFPKVLERLLNENIKNEKTYEVLNLSVDGYNAIQESELIKIKVLDYNPDLIVISYCPNDFHIGMDGGLWWHFYRGYSGIFSFISLLNLWSKYKEGLIMAEEAYGEINKVTRENNTKVIVCIFPIVISDGNLFVHPGFEELLHSLSIPYINLAPYFKKSSNNDVKKLLPDGLHPNVEGHAIAGEAIFNFLVTHFFL